MARLQKRPTLFFNFQSRNSSYVALVFSFLLLASVSYYLLTGNESLVATVALADHDPNFHVKTIATQFFEDNDAAEMIPIIKCESHFRHYEDDGSILKNREGSSAIGVAQILSSKHPDPKVIKLYNRRFDMDLKAEELDITTLEGNLGYALVLYKVRGTRDWECAKPFHW